MKDLGLEERNREHRAAITAARAVHLERKEAFSAVIANQDHLAEMRQRLASARANWRPKMSTDHIERFEDAVSDLEAKLEAAEAHCRKVWPERLEQHDAEQAAVAEASRLDREREAAEGERGRQVALARTAEAAAERRRQKQQRIAEETRWQSVA